MTAPVSTGTPRGVLTLVVLLVATLVGVIAGLLAFAGGANVPSAILTGGSAFAGAALLQLAVAHFIYGSRD